MTNSVGSLGPVANNIPSPAIDPAAPGCNQNYGASAGMGNLLGGMLTLPPGFDQPITNPPTSFGGPEPPSSFGGPEPPSSFNGPEPPALQHYTGDQADMLVRYLFELTPQEQGALGGKTPGGGK